MKLARELIGHAALYGNPKATKIDALCDYILSGDHKREIENAAFERAALEIDDMPAAMFSGDYEAAVKNRAFIRNKVRALIQPPAPKN